MRMRAFFLLGAIGALLITGNVAAEGMTYLDHLKEVNKLMCKCQAGGATTECEQKLNAISTANQNNATIKVDDLNSSICIGYLEGMGCENITKEMNNSPCTLKDLQES